MQLGQLFRAQRLRMNLTQGQLAEQTQVEMDVIRALEAGKGIDEQSLMALAAHLGLDPKDVFAAMDQAQAEPADAYARRAPGQEPMRASRARMDAPMRPTMQDMQGEYETPMQSRWQEERMPEREAEPMRRDAARAYAEPSMAGRHAAPQREQYVSPIPQDEDERLLQEIRRQRRRQAYEGTMRTQRRMQDTARMQEILRQQAEAEARRQEEARRQAYEDYRAPRQEQNFAPEQEQLEQPQQDRFAQHYESRFGEPSREAARSQARARYEQSMRREVMEQPMERPMDRPMERPVERPMERPMERPQERPVYEERPVERPAYQERPRMEHNPYDMPRMQERREPAYPQDHYASPRVQMQEEPQGHTYNQMLETAAEIAQLSGREVVLEIGCGNGELTQVLAQRSRFVAVVDTSAAALENNRAACQARGYANVDFLEGDARRLPIESASFDVVYVHMLLHHVVSAQQVLAEARRVLKPGGCLVVTEIMPSDVPAQQRIQNAIEVLKNPTHIGVISMEEVISMMQQAGLQVVDRRVQDQMWEFEQWVGVMGASERMEPLRALMRSFALQGNRAGMDLSVDKTGRMTFVYRWMYLVGVHAK